jgi:hypothetical protein
MGRQWSYKANGRPRCRCGSPPVEILRKIKSIDDSMTNLLRRGESSVHGNKLSQRLEEISGECVVVCGLPALRDKLSRAGTG